MSIESLEMVLSMVVVGMVILLGIAFITLAFSQKFGYDTLNNMFDKHEERMRDWFEMVRSEEGVTKRAESLYDKADPRAKSAIDKLLDVADPLTKSTPTDLDDDVLNWLREVTDGIPLATKVTTFAPITGNAPPQG